MAVKCKSSACLLIVVGALFFVREASAADVVVRSFGSGNGQNAVGIVEASEDTEIDGPQALTTDENGHVYLLDQINQRIVEFDPKAPAADARILQFPAQLQPTDLIVRRSEILVWDGSVHMLEPRPSAGSTSFRGLEEVNTRAADEQTVVTAFAQMGSMPPGDPADLLDQNTRAVIGKKPRPRPPQYVATRGAGSVVINIIPQGESQAQIEVRRQTDLSGAPLGRLNLKLRDRVGAVEFLEIDHRGRMFVFAEDIPMAGGLAAAFVARYSAAGELEGVYELPLGNAPLSRRFVSVSADGDVYFLRSQSGSVQVLAVGFRRLSGDKPIDVAIPKYEMPTATFAHRPIAAVRPLTRQRVIETAFAFEGVQWLVTPAAYGRDPDAVCTGFAGRVRRPFYLHGKLGQHVRGIPYCWGCHGSLDQIAAKIQRGVLAGNICTHNAPRGDAAGVDCSAFVSAAWGLATHFTTAAIPAITNPVKNPWDLRPGDALDKPGSHVMLFLRFTPNRMAEVMESSPGACNGRVCRNVYPLSSLLARGYRPVRFRALENDMTPAAAIMPEEIPAQTKRHGRTLKRHSRR